MLITLSTTYEPATDLGYLLHKHPESVAEVATAQGTAHVFYPEAGPERCTAALLLEVDPVGLAKGRYVGRDLDQYVNDRPYAASSLLAVALGKAFRTAMRGRCDARPELAATAIPLELHVPALPCRGGPELAHRLFAPLGWSVEAEPVPLTPAEWGPSQYVSLTLAGSMRVADALNHLYVLLPVLDDGKHYWVSIDEVEKLVRAGEGWLAGHPERELITTRYLAHRRQFTEALLEPADEPRPSPLSEQRRAALLAELAASGARRVLDLGCGEGQLLRELVADHRYTEVVGADVSPRSLELAARRLHLDTLSERAAARITLLQTSLTYTDPRLAGFDAAVLSEVIEHVDPPRLPALARSVFGAARPGAVLVTTPNAEYNVVWASLPAGYHRHADHRFEWTRAEFQSWAAEVGQTYGYRVRHSEVGEPHEVHGAPTQLAVFVREEG